MVIYRIQTNTTQYSNLSFAPQLQEITFLNANSIRNVTPTTYTVTVSNGKFYINGKQTPTLSLIRGNTYLFDHSTNSNDPFRISTSEDGAIYNDGADYTETVVSFTVPYTAPDTLYYKCANHSGMGGSISVSLYSSETDSYGSYIRFSSVYAQKSLGGNSVTVKCRGSGIVELLDATNTQVLAVKKIGHTEVPQNVVLKTNRTTAGIFVRVYSLDGHIDLYDMYVPKDITMNVPRSTLSESSQIENRVSLDYTTASKGRPLLSPDGRWILYEKTSAFTTMGVMRLNDSGVWENGSFDLQTGTPAYNTFKYLYYYYAYPQSINNKGYYVGIENSSSAVNAIRTYKVELNSVSETNVFYPGKLIRKQTSTTFARFYHIYHGEWLSNSYWFGYLTGTGASSDGGSNREKCVFIMKYDYNYHQWTIVTRYYFTDFIVPNYYYNGGGNTYTWCTLNAQKNYFTVYAGYNPSYQTQRTTILVLRFHPDLSITHEIVPIASNYNTYNNSSMITLGHGTTVIMLSTTTVVNLFHKVGKTWTETTTTYQNVFPEIYANHTSGTSVSIMNDLYDNIYMRCMSGVYVYDKDLSFKYHLSFTKVNIGNLMTPINVTGSILAVDTSDYVINVYGNDIFQYDSDSIFGKEITEYGNVTSSEPLIQFDMNHTLYNTNERISGHSDVSHSGRYIIAGVGENGIYKVEDDGSITEILFLNYTSAYVYLINSAGSVNDDGYIIAPKGKNIFYIKDDGSVSKPEHLDISNILSSIYDKAVWLSNNYFVTSVESTSTFKIYSFDSITGYQIITEYRITEAGKTLSIQYIKKPINKRFFVIEVEDENYDYSIWYVTVSTDFTSITSCQKILTDNNLLKNSATISEDGLTFFIASQTPGMIHHGTRTDTTSNFIVKSKTNLELFPKAKAFPVSVTSLRDNRVQIIERPSGTVIPKMHFYVKTSAGYQHLISKVLPTVKTFYDSNEGTSNYSTNITGTISCFTNSKSYNVNPTENTYIYGNEIASSSSILTNVNRTTIADFGTILSGSDFESQEITYNGIYTFSSGTDAEGSYLNATNSEEGYIEKVLHSLASKVSVFLRNNGAIVRICIVDTDDQTVYTNTIVNPGTYKENVLLRFQAKHGNKVRIISSGSIDLYRIETDIGTEVASSIYDAFNVKYFSNDHVNLPHGTTTDYINVSVQYGLYARIAVRQDNWPAQLVAGVFNLTGLSGVRGYFTLSNGTGVPGMGWSPRWTLNSSSILFKVSWQNAGGEIYSEFNSSTNPELSDDAKWPNGEVGYFGIYATADSFMMMYLDTSKFTEPLELRKETTPILERYPQYLYIAGTNQGIYDEFVSSHNFIATERVVIQGTNERPLTIEDARYLMKISDLTPPSAPAPTPAPAPAPTPAPTPAPY